MFPRKNSMLSKNDTLVCTSAICIIILFFGIHPKMVCRMVSEDKSYYLIM